MVSVHDLHGADSMNYMDMIQDLQVMAGIVSISYLLHILTNLKDPCLLSMEQYSQVLVLTM